MPNTTTRRYFANFAPQQQLALPVTSGDLSLTISSSFAGWPVTFPFYAVINYGQSDAEIIRIDAIAGTVATIGERGSDGSGAQSHSAGATLDCCFIAKDMDEANAHSSATAGVHGVAGNVVGDTDAQTLTNKTLTSPEIDDPVLKKAGAAISLPTGPDTLVGVDDTQTLTNKTLTGATIDAASTLDGVAVSAITEAWTDYTPTFGNLTSAAGTFRYRRIGKTLFIQFRFTAGTYTASGVATFTLPGGLTALGAQAFMAWSGGAGSQSFAWQTAAGSGTVTGPSQSSGHAALDTGLLVVELS